MFRGKFFSSIKFSFRFLGRSFKIVRLGVRFGESVKEVIESADTRDMVRVKTTDNSKDFVRSKFFNPVSNAMNSKRSHSDKGPIEELIDKVRVFKDSIFIGRVEGVK